jgi:glycosyltransferase involved in cell wall biosynthesis
MSHLHENKGIEDLIEAFLLLRRKIKGLRLVVADSGITTNNKIKRRLERLSRRGDVILKGIIQPEVELAHSWVYVYPIRHPQETFSIPLSLVEAQQVGTPAISTAVGAIPDYFRAEMLVPPKNPEALARKIGDFIESPTVYPLKQQFDNSDVTEQFLKLYTAARQGY